MAAERFNQSDNKVKPPAREGGHQVDRVPESHA